VFETNDLIFQIILTNTLCFCPLNKTKWLSTKNAYNTGEFYIFDIEAFTVNRWNNAEAFLSWNLSNKYFVGKSGGKGGGDVHSTAN